MSGTAFGGPGLPPTWSPGAKDLVVTAPGSSRVWATIGQGIVQEVFWPSAGRPQVRDLGFLVVGADFWSEPKGLGNYTLELTGPGPRARITHHHPRYSLELEVIVDPDRDVLLVRHDLVGVGCRLVVIVNPHLSGSGIDDSGFAAAGVLTASDGDQALAVVSASGFVGTSAGYSGTSDGWRDLVAHGELRWSFEEAPGGNIALTGALGAAQGVVALGFASSTIGATSLARAALAAGWDGGAARFDDAWNRSDVPDLPVAPALAAVAGAVGLLAMSETVLLCHEDRTFPGAIVASLASPWGDAREDLGGYHLVWARDAVESGFALVALDRIDDALRLLVHLAAIQLPDGHWPQNWFPDGSPYWTGVQLDETALPVLLAAKLVELGRIDARHPAFRPMVASACRFLAASGPVSPQDRWEENPGISPFTLAACIAALAGAAGVGFLDEADAAYARSLAADWDRRIEDWTYAAGTELDLAHGTAGHYFRLAPSALVGDRGRVRLRNRIDDEVAAVQLLGLEYVAYARFGLRDATDPRLADTSRLVDAVLRSDVAGHPYFRRYQFDGYGEHEDGSPFDGTGIGRPWPLLTAERALLAALAGDDVTVYLEALVAAATAGGMIPEQVWDAPAIPDHRLFPGTATGSAAPLVWAHSELIKLNAALRDGRPVELLAGIAAHRATVAAGPPSHWRDDTPLASVAAGRELLIDGAAPFVAHVGHDGWSDTVDLPSSPLGLGRHGVRLVPAPGSRTVQFTRRAADGSWEGVDHELPVVG